MTTQVEVTQAGVDANGSVISVETKLVFSRTVTPSASNQVVDTSAHGGKFVTIVAGEAVYVAIGTAPDATANPRRSVPAGAIRSFLIPPLGKVAVITQ